MLYNKKVALIACIRRGRPELEAVLAITVFASLVLAQYCLLVLLSVLFRSFECSMLFSCSQFCAHFRRLGSASPMSCCVACSAQPSLTRSPSSLLSAATSVEESGVCNRKTALC